MIEGTVRRFYDELWNEWRFDLADELLSDGLRFRGSLGTEAEGRAGFLEYARGVRAAFPDFHNRIDDLVVADDRATVRLTCSGTHHGEVLGVPPTGKRVEYAAAGFFTFDRSTRVADLWVLGDVAGLLEQLRPAGPVESLLQQASALLGEGRVALRIVSMPVVEFVYVGLDDGRVVVSDDGATFAEIVGLRGSTEERLPWSAERAAVAAGRFRVGLLDEGGEGYEAFRLARVVEPGASVADAVQAVARAIDGVLALHTRPDAPSHGSFFWDHHDVD